MDAPFGFRHDLDPGLFTLDRLEELRRAAPEAGFQAQLGDTDRVRPAGTGPIMTTLDGTIAEEVARRPLHLHFHDPQRWAPEYGAAMDSVLASLEDSEGESRMAVSLVIRVFSADAPAALHGDGNTQINCQAAGRTKWHFSPPSNLSAVEIESLMRGGMFLPWREMEPVETFDLGPGDGCAAPPRWPHWLEHPGPDPTVSFEISYWTASTIRDRKVYDINWMLRRAKLNPSPPGVHPSRDRVKQRMFDAVSLVTGKGGEHRGV